MTQWLNDMHEAQELLAGLRLALILDTGALRMVLGEQSPIVEHMEDTIAGMKQVKELVESGTNGVLNDNLAAARESWNEVGKFAIAFAGRFSDAKQQE